jgi:hypothetical protein
MIIYTACFDVLCLPDEVDEILRLADKASALTLDCRECLHPAPTLFERQRLAWDALRAVAVPQAARVWVTKAYIAAHPEHVLVYEEKKA